jgi:hypothetical protein
MQVEGDQYLVPSDLHTAVHSSHSFEPFPEAESTINHYSSRPVNECVYTSHLSPCWLKPRQRHQQQYDGGWVGSGGVVWIDTIDYCSTKFLQKWQFYCWYSFYIGSTASEPTVGAKGVLLSCQQSTIISPPTTTMMKTVSLWLKSTAAWQHYNDNAALFSDTDKLSLSVVLIQMN